MKEEIQDLIENQFELDLSEFNDHYEVIEKLDYDGSLHELIDSNIDIYYHSLRQWAVDNYDYVEQAINEGLLDTSEFDYHKAIQTGQYLQLQEEAYRLIEEIFEEFEPEEEEELETL